MEDETVAPLDPTRVETAQRHSPIGRISRLILTS